MKKIEFDILTIQELYAFARRTMGIITEHIEGDAFISSVSSLMNNSLNKLSVVMGLQRENEITEKLVNRENARDKAFTGLLNLVKANINHQNHHISTSAQKVYYIFEQNRLIQTTIGNDSFNTKINFLLNDLVSVNMEKDLKSVGMKPWIDQLEKTHEEYLAFLKQSNDEESIKLLPVLKGERENIKQYLTGLFGYIDIYKESKKDSFSLLSDKLNDVIVDILSVAKSRVISEEN